MAGDAEPHVVHSVHLVDLGHALDVAMAGHAGVRTERFDVSLMGKVGVAREIMNPNPFYRLLFIPRLAKFPDLGLASAVAASDDQMASHAGLHRGDTRLRRDGDRVVAVLALDLVLTGVDVVAEENRLARSFEAATIGGGEHGSQDRICDRASLLGLRRDSSEREKGNNASGCHATDDE
jgi:hypothetical protein